MGFFHGFHHHPRDLPIPNGPHLHRIPRVSLSRRHDLIGAGAIGWPWDGQVLKMCESKNISWFCEMNNFHFAGENGMNLDEWMIIWGGNITWNAGRMNHGIFQVMSLEEISCETRKPKTPLGMEYGQLGPWGEYMCSICQWMCYMGGFCVEQHNFRKKMVDGTRILHTQSSDLDPKPRVQEWKRSQPKMGFRADVKKHLVPQFIQRTAKTTRCQQRTQPCQSSSKTRPGSTPKCQARGYHPGWEFRLRTWWFSMERLALHGDLMGDVMELS